MRVQELFTEFKKIKRQPNTDVANTAPFREIFPYNREKCPKNWKILTLAQKILCTGRSNNPHFGFLVSFYDSWGPDRAGFWIFYFSGIFQDLMSRIFWKIPENGQIWAENGQNFPVKWKFQNLALSGLQEF